MTGTIIIAGTDTDVGKTVFAAGVCGLVDGDYWKPVQAGRTPSTDSETVVALSGLSPDRICPERYVLDMAASPHTAATAEGREIDAQQLSRPTTSRMLIIETAGGLMVPLTNQQLQIDVMASWQAPVILCARTKLGTINHTLLSIEALKRRAIPVIGVAFIGDESLDAETTICRLGGVRRLGRLPHVSPLNVKTLRQAMQDNFDPASLLGIGSGGP